MNKSELLQENETLVKILMDMRDQIDAQLDMLEISATVDLDDDEEEDAGDDE